MLALREVTVNTRWKKGFTLVDVLIAVVLTTVLVLLVASFVRETVSFSTYFSRHQQIRSETFALVNNVLSSLIREAVSLRPAPAVSPAQELTLYMDKFETPERAITLRLRKSPAESGVSEERSQLVLIVGDGTSASREYYLNSERTYVESFQVRQSLDPTSGSSTGLQERRAVQPMVEVYLRSRFQRLNPDRPEDSYTFFEDPRISFQSRFTLRNYSFSNLR